MPGRDFEATRRYAVVAVVLGGNRIQRCRGMSAVDGTFRRLLIDRAGVAGVSVADEWTEPLQEYFELLRKWNARINLTALSLAPPSKEAIDRVFVEPLVAAVHISALGRAWIDLGSGAGSPAVPLKIARPALGLTMIESRGRKAAFLREVVRTLELPGAAVEGVRFETLVSAGRTAAMVTARALRVDDALVRTVTALLPSGGELLLFRNELDVPDVAGFVHRGTIGLVPATGASLVRYERE